MSEMNPRGIWDLASSIVRLGTHYGSMASYCLGMALETIADGESGLVQVGRYCYGRQPKFSKEVEDKAWTLLEEYMSPDQYFAFMEDDSIELVDQTNRYRLIINRNGEFLLLQGPRGAGIVVIRGTKNGRIKSRNYPLGDEIATFIDWFRYKPDQLIASWNCGVYSITKKGEGW